MPTETRPSDPAAMDADDIPMKFPEYRGGFPTLDQWDAVYDILYRALPEQKTVLDKLTKEPAPVTPKRWTKFVIALFDAIPEESHFIMGIADLFDSSDNYYIPGNATLGITKDMFRADGTGEVPAAPLDGERSDAVPYRFAFENRLEPCAEITPLADVTA